MDFIYIFLIRNDVWIYILCALGIVWYFSELVKARAILRQAMFGLERERGRRIQTKAVTLLMLLGAVVIGVAYVNLQVAPTLPPDLLRPPTPTPDIFSTPLSSPTPMGPPQPEIPTPTPPIVPTVTLRSSEGGAPVVPPPPISTPLPGAGDPPPPGGNGVAPAPPSDPPPPVGAVGCSPSVAISSPESGATVSGSISFFGSANDPNFAFYRLEANGPETNGSWASIIGGTVDQPVFNGLLGSASMGGWAPGVYSFRLTVVDLTSNEAGQCLIQLTLE
jgi:hypothetical protein